MAETERTSGGASEAVGREEGERLRRWATRASVAVACVLIAAKLVVYLFTGSVSLLSSLLDSITDAMASLVTLYGVIVATRPPDQQHRFGHGKAEPLAALAQAAFILGAACLLTIEAVGRLWAPQPVGAEAAGVAVMVFSMVMTVGLLRFQRHVIRRTGSLAVGADSLHYAGDLLMNGAVIAAIVLTAWSGWQWIDPAFALGIVGFLVRGATIIAKGALDALMDRELPPEERERILAVASAHPGQRGVHDLRTRSDGVTSFAELHMEFDPFMPIRDAHAVTEEVEKQLKDEFPAIEIVIHQEPKGIADDRLDSRIEHSS